MTDPSQSRFPFSSQQAIPVPGQQALDYWIDGWQRTILFWDVLRQRSDQYYAQKGEGGTARTQFRSRTGAGRADRRAAGQLPAGARQTLSLIHI